MSFWNGRKMMNALLAGDLGQLSINLLAFFWLIAAAVFHLPLMQAGPEIYVTSLLGFLFLNIIVMGIYSVLFINSKDGRKVLPAAWVGLTFPVIFRGLGLIAIAYGLVTISLLTGIRIDLASKFLMDPSIPALIAGISIIYMVIYAHSCLRPVHNWKSIKKSPLPNENKRKTNARRRRSILFYKRRKNLLTSRI